ncbi:ParA family protein [Vibrio alginolyticus]
MIIAIAHNKGGVGKTTVTLNLAAILKPDVIVDQDTHQSLVIINKLRGDGQLPIHTCDSRASLIELLKQSDDGKTVLIDCGGFDSDVNRLAVAAADLVIVPANDDTTELIGLRRFDEVLAEISKEMDSHITAHVLFNRVHPNRRKFNDVEDFLKNASHMSRLDTIIPTRKQYPLAVANGLGVVEHKATKYSDAAREMKRLAEEIQNKASLN